MRSGDSKPDWARPLPERGETDLRTLGKVLAMTKDPERTAEPGSVPRSSEYGPPRKPYGGPQLQEWGSITELTGAGSSGFADVDNDQGSEGV